MKLTETTKKAAATAALGVALATTPVLPDLGQTAACRPFAAPSLPAALCSQPGHDPADEPPSGAPSQQPLPAQTIAVTGHQFDAAGYIGMASTVSGTPQVVSAAAG